MRFDFILLLVYTNSIIYERSDTITQTRALKEAVARYDKKNIQGLYIKLHKEKDKDIIQKLASVKSKQGYIKKLIREDLKMEWIPCSERLPNSDEAVLVTHSHGVSKAWWNGIKWQSGTAKKLNSVIAWMPLPAPYIGKSE